MSHVPQANIEQFLFRHLHPNIKLGTASDRYAGWLGQIYSEERYRGRLKHRTKVVRERTFTEMVLPVESVAEYFEHFPVLEIDFTFYRPLLDQHGKPTQAFQVLKAWVGGLGVCNAVGLWIGRYTSPKPSHQAR